MKKDRFNNPIAAALKNLFGRRIIIAVMTMTGASRPTVYRWLQTEDFPPYVSTLIYMLSQTSPSNWPPEMRKFANVASVSKTHD
jgi:hypothetical protein